MPALQPPSSWTKANVVAALSTLTSANPDALAQGETDTIAGIGKFAARTRAARQGRKSRAGDPIAVPAGCLPSRPQRPSAARSTLSARNPVDSYPVLVAVVRTQHGGAFALAPRTSVLRSCRINAQFAHPRACATDVEFRRKQEFTSHVVIG